MSEVHDDQERRPPMNRIWKGRFANSPADFEDRVMVIIPDLDPTLQIGPARWQSRDATSMPIRGDDCLVIFDNDREPWVVAWWPF